MSPAISLALAGLRHRPTRTVLRLGVVTVAVALLAGMILFIGNALRSASASALNQVPLDLQAPVTSFAKDQQAAAGVGRQPGVAYAAAAATAPFSSAERSAGGISTQTSQGAILAVPADYAARVHTFRMLQGGLRPGGVVLDQQMAATLQAKLGDTVRLRPRPNSPPVSYKVTGVGLITAPDQVFQPLNPLLGPAPAQPPAERRDHAHGNLRQDAGAPPAGDRHGRLGRERAARRPDRHTVAGAGAARPRPAHVGQPLHAPTSGPTQTVNRIQSSLPGQVQFVDNLSDSLNTAAGDALYAETLFLLLAVPGALIALGVAYLAALGTSESDRRDLALLRARGARPRDLLKLAAVESVMIGLVAGHPRVRARFRRGPAARRAAAPTDLLARGGHRARRGRARDRGVGGGSTGEHAGGAHGRGQRGPAQRPGPRSVPAWRRYYLDFLCLALSGLIYWLTIRTGFSAVLSPDSNPTLSLSVYMFFGPALLWIGATLLLVRLRGRFMSAAGAPRGSSARQPLGDARLEPRTPSGRPSTVASS